MAMIRVKNLTFTYPGSYDPVFEDMTVQFDTGWNLGLVGRNGRGKTTFLRLLLGEYEYRGCVEVPVPLRYFPYPVQDPALSTAEASIPAVRVPGLSKTMTASKWTAPSGEM